MWYQSMVPLLDQWESSFPVVSLGHQGGIAVTITVKSVVHLFVGFWTTSKSRMHSRVNYHKGDHSHEKLLVGDPENDLARSLSNESTDWNVAAYFRLPLKLLLDASTPNWLVLLFLLLILLLTIYAPLFSVVTHPSICPFTQLSYCEYILHTQREKADAL